MTKSAALVRAETKLKKLQTEVKASEKRIKHLVAKDAKAVKSSNQKPVKKPAIKKVTKPKKKPTAKKAIKKKVAKSSKK